MIVTFYTVFDVRADGNYAEISRHRKFELADAQARQQALRHNITTSIDRDDLELTRRGYSEPIYSEANVGGYTPDEARRKQAQLDAKADAEAAGQADLAENGERYAREALAEQAEHEIQTA